MSSTEFPAGFFRRVDDSPDEAFYAEPRKVVHLDDSAIAAVTTLYDEVIPEGADVLDLMSSWRSHLPAQRSLRVVGLGMNAEEMKDNPQLDQVVVHNLNERPVLPFEDASFDAVVCCVSVQYLTQPLNVFAEVARVLRPEAPFVVTFSNRCFPVKAVAAWLYSDDAQHIAMVSNYFSRTHGLDPPKVENRSPARGDPLFAVWARRTS